MTLRYKLALYWVGKKGHYWQTCQPLNCLLGQCRKCKETGTACISAFTKDVNESHRWCGWSEMEHSYNKPCIWSLSRAICLPAWHCVCGPPATANLTWKKALASSVLNITIARPTSERVPNRPAAARSALVCFFMGCGRERSYVFGEFSPFGNMSTRSSAMAF